MSELTIKDLICFYSAQPDDMANCPITLKYVLSHIDKSGYIPLADIFEAGGNKKKKNDDDMAFYDYMCSLVYKNKYIFDSEVQARVKIFEPIFKYKDSNLYSQKWHLLVSLYAYLDVVNNKNVDLDETKKKIFENSSVNKKRKIYMSEKIQGKDKYWQLINKQGYSCRPLKLWMAEAAGIDKVKLNEAINNGMKIEWDLVAEKINKKMTYIVHKSSVDSSSKQLLKLNRETRHLELYIRSKSNLTFDDVISTYNNIDISDYYIYRMTDSFPCVLEEQNLSIVPGIFIIKRVSEVREEYISACYKNLGRIKFFGYITIFNNCFIHGNVYNEDVTIDKIDNEHIVVKDNENILNGIRVYQEDLEWLVENIKQGATLIM